MKYLLPPAFAVLFSTAGTVYGCHVAGMPLRDVLMAGGLASGVSLAAASTAVALSAARSNRNPIRQGAAPTR